MASSGTARDLERLALLQARPAEEVRGQRARQLGSADARHMPSRSSWKIGSSVGSLLRGNWDRAGAPVPSARPCRDLVAWTDPLVELRPRGLAHLEVRSAAPVPHRVVLIPAYPA